MLRRRHGKDDVEHTSESEFLRSVRDRVLDNAGISEGEVLLDVGTGDGLIAFGALERVGEHGQVIFSDVSQDLLDHCQILAAEASLLDRCHIVRAPADDLGMLKDSSVDVVTTRSVLIYVKDKSRAFEEFYRVLKPGGRISIFEPINRFKHPQPGRFLGYDVTPVEDLARKVWAVYERIQPTNSDPMLDFDERNLFDLAEKASFEEVHLRYEAEVKSGTPSGWGTHRDGWETLVNSAGNPKIPTVGEAINKALTPDEAERFVAYLRPLVDGNQQRRPTAEAYLWAVKSREG